MWFGLEFRTQLLDLDLELLLTWDFWNQVPNWSRTWCWIQDEDFPSDENHVVVHGAGSQTSAHDLFKDREWVLGPGAGGGLLGQKQVFKGNSL